MNDRIFYQCTINARIALGARGAFLYNRSQLKGGRLIKVITMKIKLLTNKKILLLATLVLFSTVAYLHYHFKKNTADDENAVLVQTAKPKETAISNEIHAIGSLTAKTVEVSAEMPGYVKAILFKDGTFVKAGTPLIQLDDTEYIAKHETADAQLSYTQKNYKRMSTLGERGIIPQDTIDQLQSTLLEKKALDEQAETQLAKMKLTAPFDGIVGECKVNPGNYVSVGQSVVTLTDKKNLRVEYNVPETFLPYLVLGQTVVITTNAYPGKTYTGKLSYIAPSINTDNRSISLYADITNETGELSPGMFVQITQLLDTRTKALMVPAKSLVPVMDGEQIYKVVNHQVEAVNVKIGKRVGDLVEIVEGVSLNDVIITDGQFKVYQGSPVKIKS